MSHCVINLTRFGDLLQTQAVISGLAASDGVELVCLENFATTAGLLRDVSAVHPLPGAEWLAGLDNDWRRSLASVAMWTRAVGASSNRNSMVNLTPSLAARLLTRMLAGKGEAIGFSMDEHGFGQYSDPWTCFLQVSSSNRGSSPFNMVDLLWQMAGLGAGEKSHRLADPTVAEINRSKAVLAGLAPVGCNGFVAFQLGASRPERCWPEDFFARLGSMIWEKFALCPVLLGAAPERDLAAGFEKAADSPCIDLVGKTSLTQLAGMLKACRLLVSNDTGTMHLGSGLGMPVAALFLATAQPWDTGPYHQGSICLEPDLACHPCEFSASCDKDHACRRAVQPEDVFTRVEALLENRDQKPGAPMGARVWQTVRDGEGFHDLVSLSGHEHTDRTQWIRMQRSFYRPFLNRQDVTVEDLFHPSLSLEAAGAIEEVLGVSEQLLLLLQEQTRTLLKMPGPALRKKVLGTLQRIQYLWRDNRYLAVLGLLWQQQTQESGRDMAEFLELLMRYRQLVRVLRNAVRHGS